MPGYLFHQRSIHASNPNWEGVQSNHEPRELTSGASRLVITSEPFKIILMPQTTSPSICNSYFTPGFLSLIIYIRLLHSPIAFI